MRTTMKARSNRTPAAAAKPALQPLRVLAVIEGTEQTNRILNHLASLSGSGRTLEVVVLNVQERRTDARLRGYETFKQSEVEDRLRNEVAAPIVSSAARWLGKANIDAEIAVEIGDPLDAILATAAGQRCGLIVVGAPYLGRFSRWLAKAGGLLVSRSVAAQLLAVSPIPVAVVR
jgi:nucleotide-binding universal stress UspA family protein